jgi:hypothetical protein
MSARESPPPEEKAHDILAAEAFAMPAADPTLRHQPIALPDDPTGIAEPHDVLAAEEFALPAPPPPDVLPAPRRQVSGPARAGALAAVALLVLRAVRRRRRSG